MADAARNRWMMAIALVAVLAVACSGQPPANDAATGDTGATEGSLVGDEPGTSGTGKAGKGKSATGETGTEVSTGTGGTGTVGTGTGGAGSKAKKKASGWADANLFSGDANTQGWTDSRITLCEHAGITLASAFGNDPDHFDAYWRMVNDDGGVFGRDVNLVLQDDGYNANQAVQAFDGCNSANPFFIVGGIGFDQIPAVRQRAEANSELYIYGTATEKGTSGNKYSYSVAPTVEEMGRRFAEATAKYNKGSKVGVLTVNSDGWKGGAETYTARLKQLGMNVAITREIANNNDVLTSHVSAFEGAGIDFVFLNINALAFTRFVTEADSQGYYPKLMGWSFNLVTETVGGTMRRFPNNQGLSVSPVHDPERTYDWTDEYKRMKAAYVEYYGNDEPNDIDWIQWIAMKGFHRMLLDCGSDCTRNKLAGMLDAGYATREKPNCRIDFGRGGGRFGGYLVNYWQGINRGNTHVWKQVETCRPSF